VIETEPVDMVMIAPETKVCQKQTTHSRLAGSETKLSQCRLFLLLIQRRTIETNEIFWTHCHFQAKSN